MLTAIDLCSGVGAGFPLAMVITGGFKLNGLCEPDEFCCARLRDRFPNIPIHPDVRDLWLEQGDTDLISCSPPCFAEGTLVLTKQGYRPIESLLIGDMVLTHKGRWREITSIMQRTNAPVRTIKAGGVPSLVTTDEHPFYIRCQSRQLKKRPDGAWQEYRVFSEPVWVSAKDLTKNSRLGQVLPFEKQSDKSPDFWWIVGRYLADGWRCQIRAGTGNRVRICCSYKEADYLEDRIKKCFHTYRINDKTTVRFEINSNEFHKFLESFGSGAGGKTLPGEMLSLDRVSARSLLEGWSSGDGYV